MRVLVTGSSGLIGSQAVRFYDARGAEVHGIDNNMRRDFFGPMGDTRWNLQQLRSQCRNFVCHEIDIRDRMRLRRVFRATYFDLIVHCAAQPSHDLAASRPYDDFEVNAMGTLNLLEATRRYCPEAVFAFMSTNKVYGDGPNHLNLVESESRYDFADPAYRGGIAENFSIDQNLHSLFGASKAAADLLVQEYGRYFGMRTGVFRGGCLTGEDHSAVQLHGFLSYLVKTAVAGETYTIIGYQGKQVRDQISSYDVITAIDAFYQEPRCGEVYNIGGGKGNSASVIECIHMLEGSLGRPVSTRYEARARRGDHICYYTNLNKLQTHFPNWQITQTLPQILERMISACRFAEETAHV